jgi:succinyl-CoA synthetase beta subunit/citryl-CoA synthetase large subunit
VVLKSQVLSGGRMKAGAIRFADAPEEVPALFERILRTPVRGLLPESVLVEEKSPVAQEYYAGVTWDGRRKLPVVVFSDLGGIDIEEVAERHPEHVAKLHASTLLPPTPRLAKEAISATGVKGDDLVRLTPIVFALLELFLRYDLTLAEINPLAKLAGGRFVVLDGHVDLEAEARELHRELLAELGIRPEETRQARPPTPFEIAGARVDASDHRGVAGNVVEFDGNLGLVIGAGGGSLTLFDAVRQHGGRPANYCEIGGNPSVRKACELTKLVLGKPGVEKIAVMMNVVSNTRVDIVARGVIKGCIESGRDPREAIAVFRIPGSWEEEGRKILRRYGVEHCDRSVSMYEAAGRAVAKLRGAPAGR